ncbi:replication protein [Psychroserpens sp. SPM9]|uniref:replication protein n=1 Tax=Psychroserpens sp. SPM9 TaxID=2975598 RepID=UPI0021A4B0CE|nr:replication protein [Psychroserpens sp. SPM9]MDG5490616.1 replication protein [Psychroserpens sp. SPM9]
MRLKYTTPIPNRFFDELMIDLSASAVRVYLKIARNTYGWRDPQGNVKPRDWISHSQFSKVGLSSRSVTTAITELLELDLITLTDDYGNILNNPQKRKNAKRIYYALKTINKENYTLDKAKNDKNKGQILPRTKEIPLQKLKANERLTDQERMQEILQNEEEKQIKRDNWY